MKLKRKTKISYGLAGVGDSAFYNLAGTFFIFFLSTIVGLDPGVAGTIAAVGAIWETLCGAVVGYLSDHTRTRFGRRKPYLLIAAFPLALFTSLVFTAIDAGAGFRAFYYTVMVILFWTSFSVFFVPYLAWGAELTQDYDERTVLRGYTFLFNNLGMAIGMILPNILVDLLMQWGKSESGSWQMMAIFCGLCSGLTIFAGALGIRDPKELEPEGEELGKKKDKSAKRRKDSLKKIWNVVADMVKNYVQILRLRAIRFILGASIFYLIGYAIFCSDRMYFFTYNMRLSPGAITVVMAIMTFASSVFVPVIPALGRRFDKRTLFIVGMALSVAVMGLYGFIGVSSLAAAGIYAIAYCMGSICYWQLIPAMIYDVCEVDQLVNRKERAGLVISLQSLSESLANAVGLQLLGLILKFAGFNGTASVQAQSTLLWTHLCFTLIPVLFMILSIVMMARYPVTKEMYNRVLSALEQRKRGEEIDMEPFKGLK
ncbi:MAG: MFS transporter [Clostridia bacterium]